MNVNNLLFFDKNGESYNFSLNDSGYWEGADYFLPISLALFDVSNIFILENTTPLAAEPTYRFPTMETGSSFEIKWVTKKSKDTFFLFTVQKEGFGPNDHTYINQESSITVNHSDFGVVGTLDLTYPMQVNVAFTPAEEISYTRVLQIYYNDGVTSTLILELTFYGEGEDEDERYKVWLENFGVKFNREDALLLKDYDLKEGLPDWSQINLARKNLLVNIDQVYPYIGTYKGMVNLINLLGFKDVLRVKEYWQDSDINSVYYQKYAMVDVTDLMNIGDITQINLIDINGQIKRGAKFKKTEFLAITYSFTVATDEYDDDGLPEVVSTTDFTVDEIFYKLHGVANKLKQEILPVNVQIKDVIGEFIYFTKLNLRNWSDTTFVESLDINDDYTIKILSPDVVSTQLKIRDLKTLYPKLVGPSGLSDFPGLTYNSGTVYPYENGQEYSSDQIDYLTEAIYDYYDVVTNYEYYHIDETSPIDVGDDTSPNIGCPIVLEAYIPDLTLRDLRGVTFADLTISEATTSSTLNTIASSGTKYFNCATVQSFRVGDRVKITVNIDQSLYMEGTITEIAPLAYTATTIAVNITNSSGSATSTGWTVNLIDSQYTLGFLKYKNSYEIEWIIDGPQNYHFEWRAPVQDVHIIPHILPYSGDYTIELKVHDMHGSTSTAHKYLTVISEEPLLEAFIRIQDKTSYTFGDLHNVTIGDLSESPLYFPYATVLNLNGEDSALSSVYSHYLDWFTYANQSGVGSPQSAAKIYNPLSGFESYETSTHASKHLWGTGSANGQPLISDYSTAMLKELKFVTFAEMGYVGDSIDGFYIDFKNLSTSTPTSYLTNMQFGGYDEVEFFMLLSTPTEFVTYMDNLDPALPGWEDYRYQVIGDRVKATAKVQDKKNHSILKFASTLSGVSYEVIDVPTTGLLGHWKFAEDYYDTGVFDNLQGDATYDGVVLTAPVYAPNQYGVEDSALTIPGATFAGTGFVNVGLISNLRTVWSVGAWIKDYIQTIDDVQDILIGGHPAIYLALNASVGYVGFRDSAAVTHQLFNNNVLSDGDYHLLVFTGDGTNIIAYLDGLPVATITPTTTQLYFEIIGAWGTLAPNYQPHVTIAETFFHERVLTSTEVFELYEGQATAYNPSSVDLDISSKIIHTGIVTLIQTEMLGTEGPYWSSPSGLFSAGPSGPFWEGPSGPYYDVSTSASGPYWITASGLITIGPSGIGPSSWPYTVDTLWPDPTSDLWPEENYTWLFSPESRTNWLFPTIYSNTNLQLGDRLRIRNSSGGYAEGYVVSLSDYQIEIDVDLINKVGNFFSFDLAIIDTVYTFEKPEHVFDSTTLTSIQATLLQAQAQLDEDLLFLTCPFEDQLISLKNHKNANASNIQYWIDNGYVSYDNDEGTQTGFLPSSYDQSSLNTTNVRATYDTIVAPLYHPVFVIISNLTSNAETEWTLSLDGTNIITIKNTSYFIWRFDTVGLYRLTAKSTDARGNISIVTTNIDAVFSMEVDQYKKYVEKLLDDRKFEMTHS